MCTARWVITMKMHNKYKITPQKSQMGWGCTRHEQINAKADLSKTFIFQASEAKKTIATKLNL